MQQGQKLLSIPEAANALNVKPVTIRAWAAARRIAKVKLGRAVRIPSSEIDRLINEGLVPARFER